MNLGRNLNIMSPLIPISGCENTSRRADVIFVHGLGGDASETWRHGEDDSTSWPHWLGGDFPEIGVWSLSYAASPMKRLWLKRLLGFNSKDSGEPQPLPDRALQVLDDLSNNALGQRPLMFICHSLGGLLVKQLLRKSDESPETRLYQVARHTQAVLFLATPHAGATLASLVHKFKKVFGSTVSIEELRIHDAHLRDLYDWYRNHAQRLGIETITYYETLPVRGILPIVNPTSAHPAVGADPVGLDEDHISISKPRDKGAQVYTAVQGLLRNNLIVASQDDSRNSESRKTGTPVISSSPHEVVIRIEPGANGTQQLPRIPCELPPAADRFIGRDKQLKLLTSRLLAGLSTAVLGPAGLGKTALAASALEAVVGVNGVNLASSPFPDGIVYLDLYAIHGQAEAAWNKIAHRLCGPEFMQETTPFIRASEACHAKRVLVIIEGGEEADGIMGRTNISELLDALSPECRFLLLTRMSTQVAMAETVELKEALLPDEAASLLDYLTERCPLNPESRRNVLELLEGHPLALNWAGNLIARDDEDPVDLIRDWQAGGLPKLSDPKLAKRTLKWIFNRSVRGLNDTAREVLSVAGLLAPTPFPLEPIVAGIGHIESGDFDDHHAHEALKSLVQRGLLHRVETKRWQFTHVLAYRFTREELSTDTVLRERLAQWLYDELNVNLRNFETGDGPSTVTNLLQHCEALLFADDASSLWEPLASGLLYYFADRLTQLGRLDLVYSALSAVSNWLIKLTKDKLGEAFWIRQQYVTVAYQGDVLLAQGDLSGALAAYRESMEVSRRLSESDPSNAGWQRDLSVSQDRIGDVLFAQGDLSGALAVYRESMEVRRRLSESDPSHAGWQRDLSYSLIRLAEFYEHKGELRLSISLAEESLMIDERLSMLDPSNVTWQRDVDVSRRLVTRLRKTVA